MFSINATSEAEDVRAELDVVTTDQRLRGDPCPHRRALPALTHSLTEVLSVSRSDLCQTASLLVGVDAQRCTLNPTSRLVVPKACTLCHIPQRYEKLELCVC